MRRRRRERDPLANPSAIRGLLEELQQRCPQIIPFPEGKLRQLLAAVKHLDRSSSSETSRGRPGNFDQEIVIEAGRHLKAILSKRSRGRISPSTFIGFYLPILDYPVDVVQALENGKINRLEASLLSRLTPERLETTLKGAQSVRREVLENHLRVEGSQNSLRQKVAELLGDETLITSHNMTAAVREVDELLKIDENDKRHLFYEQMKEFFFALREIKADEIDDRMLTEILEASDRLMGVIHTLQLKRRQQAQIQERKRRLMS